MSIDNVEPQIRGYALAADEGVPGRDPEVKASSSSTAGSMALYRSIIDGAGPPPHVHQHEDEAIFVLSGTIEAECGRDTFTAPQGGFIFLPRGLRHTFRSIGGPAEILFLAVPGRIDEFFVERDRLMAAGASQDEVIALIQRFGF